MYLEKDTQDLDIVTNKSWKFSNVGFCAKNFGGKRNNSSNGFNAWLIENTRGIAIITAIIPRNR